MTLKNTSLSILIAIAGAATVMIATAALSTVVTASADHHDNSTTTTAANATRVSVGMGNLTVSYNQFYPQDVQISVGESVTFFNPSPEIHNVVFPLDNTTMSDIILPFSMSAAPQFELLQPYDLGEPWVEPGPNGTQILVMLNKVAFVPSTVDMAGNIQYLNGTDVSYTLTGEEDTVSSGLVFPPEEELMAMFAQMFPEEFAAENMTQTEEPAMAESNATGTEVETFPNVNTFTVTFEEPGTYEYFCAFHPAMYGTVTVN
ncbi:MAG TPA: plastocyanin/azurin family copper-binding protein [Nitrososphaera sp.]|nr:plastocyanin/azurin family copper-binding protein [Nitrososphaera sp.]